MTRKSRGRIRNGLAALSACAILSGGAYLARARMERSDWGHVAQQSRRENLVIRDAVLAAGEVEARLQAARARESGADVRAPSRAAYVSEARRDPHRVPRSLLRFADELAEQMERALVSRDYAALLYPELERCARDLASDAPVSARAVCAVNAGRLAERYPDLFESRFRGFRGALPSAVAVVVGSAGY